jgi:ATP-dependent protease ClpP protease subunit
MPTFELFGTIQNPDPIYEIVTGEPEPGVTGIADLKKFLSENEAATEIEILINSPGGDAQMGLDIHDALVASGKVIHCRVEGVCYSAATPALLAAPAANRSMLENSTVGIHLPYIPPYTLADAYTADELQSLADGMRVFEELYIKLYADTTSLSTEELRALMEKETIMNSEMALQNGFVSEILKTNIVNLSQLKAVAFISNQKNMDTIKEKFSAWDKIMQKIDGWFKAKDEVPPEPTPEPPAPPVISQEEFDALKAENETLKAKITELEAVKTETENIKAEFTALKTEVETFKSTYKPEGRMEQPKRENLTFEERKEALRKMEEERKAKQ